MNLFLSNYECRRSSDRQSYPGTRTFPPAFGTIFFDETFQKYRKLAEISFFKPIHKCENHLLFLP